MAVVRLFGTVGFRVPEGLCCNISNSVLHFYCQVMECYLLVNCLISRKSKSCRWCHLHILSRNQEQTSLSQFSEFIWVAVQLRVMFVHLSMWERQRQANVPMVAHESLQSRPIIIPCLNSAWNIYLFISGFYGCSPLWRRQMKEIKPNSE